MKFFHLSHTDLDGYGCQLITKKIFPDAVFYNANYGLEVKMFMQDILEQIKLSPKDKDIFFMITDLNLTMNEAKNLNKQIDKFNNNGYKIKLQLLDHHGTGQKSADKFGWYYLVEIQMNVKFILPIIEQHYLEFKNFIKTEF